MKILVTGGAGFIGSNFIRYMLSNHECEIVNFDKLTYAGNLDNLTAVEANPHYTFVKGDIASRKQVEEVFTADINYVINFAAESHVDRSIKKSDTFVRTNVLGTQVLLEAARGNGVEKFVQISTDEVYGSLEDGGFFTEDSALAPGNPYAATKASADLMVLSYYHTYGLPVIITRSSNNYGPYQYPEKIIPRFVTNALRDKQLPLYGDGRNIRDWLHVKDHCRALAKVLIAGSTGEIYNIGASNEISNRKLTGMILEILDKPESLIVKVTDRPGHDYRYALDWEKIEKETGWKPEYDFRQGLKETIDWYCNNKWWWEEIKEP